MRKIFTLAALLLVMVVSVNATKKYATFETPASQGSWNAETCTYTWTAGYSNLVTIFQCGDGSLAEYKSIHLTTSEYTDAYRICFMTGNTAVATIAFYSAGQKDINFADRSETKNLDLSKIDHIAFGGASGSGSIVVQNVYIEKPMEVVFGDDGKYTVDFSDISVTGDLTFDEATGTLTSTGSGTLKLNIGEEDFTQVTNYALNCTDESGIINYLHVGDAINVTVADYYSSKYNATPSAERMAKSGHVNSIYWNINAAGTVSISSIIITSNVIKAVNPALADVTALPYKAWSGVGPDATVTGNAYPQNNVGTAMGQGSTIYGDGNVSRLNYVNLTGYSTLKIKTTVGAAVRICMNRAESGTGGDGDLGVDQTLTAGSDGYATYDLTGLEYAHLHCVKLPWNGATVTVTSIEAVDPNTTTSYVLSGSGVMTSTTKAALADETATLIDATGVTGTNVSLVSANPNCIFKANEGVLANENNVMVGTTISSLALTDGKPFAVPSGATATAATYTRAAGGTYGTICLPYAVNSDANVQYYTLGANDGTTLTIEPVSTVAAGTPAIFKTAAENITSTGSGALSANVNGSASTGTVLTLKGTYTQQNFTTDLDKKYYISGNQVKQATSSLTVRPFRAYMEASGASAKSFNLEIDDATEINTLFNADQSDIKVAAIYNVNGVQQSELQRGLNIVKFSNGTTKKVILK